MPRRNLSDIEQNRLELNRQRTARAIEKRTKADAIARLRTGTVSGGDYDNRMVPEETIEKK